MDSWEPYPKQAEFLAAPEDEVLFGGAAGGGKSDALLVDALGIPQGAWQKPLYRALLVRKTFPQLRRLIERSHQLYPRAIPGAEFRDRPWTEWRLPSGAKIVLGAVDRDADVLAYQGAEFQYIGIDELGHYSTSYVWDYLSSRLRTPDPDIACYQRGTCNPGPKWIQDRWGIPDEGSSTRGTRAVTLEDGRTIIKHIRFIQSKLSDNPALAKDGRYEANLQLLSRQEREALLHGRWGVVEVPGQVYREELDAAREQGRVTGVPYDKAAPVSTYWDLGIADPTVIWCIQRVGREWHAIDYYEARSKAAADHAAWLKARGYIYDEHWLPHDAFTREMGSGLTYEEVLLQHGIRVRQVPRLGVEEGIAAVRTVFPALWIDSRNCEQGMRCLQFYRREWKDKQGQYGDPVHDQYSHGADALRYFAVTTRQMAPEYSAINLPALDSRWPKGL